MRGLFIVGMALVGGCYYSGPKGHGDDGMDHPPVGAGDDGTDDGSGAGGDCADGADECVPGSSECVGNGVQACRRVDGCAQLTPVQPCGSGSVCSDGVCVVDQPTTQANLYIGPQTLCYLQAGDILCDVSLCNGGSVTSAASTIKFFLDAPPATATCADPAIPGEMWFAVDPVAAGSCTMTGPVLFYDDPAPGLHRLALFADGLCETVEFDEADNYVVLTPDLMVTPPTQPELWFDAASRLYWDAMTGDFYGDIRVCNVGSADAGQFFVDIAANSATAGCGWNGDEWQSYPSLAAGACTPWWSTTHRQPGTGFWKSAKVMIDSTCSVVESNEDNVWQYDYF